MTTREPCSTAELSNCLDNIHFMFMDNPVNNYKIHWTLWEYEKIFINFSFLGIYTIMDFHFKSEYLTISGHWSTEIKLREIYYIDYYL